MNDQIDPKKLAEEMLESTRKALMSGDFEAMVQHFRFPNVVETFEGKKHIRTLEEMKTTFDSVRAHFESAGITDMVRECLEADFEDNKTLRFVHETRLLAGSKQVGRPYPVYSRAKKIKGEWKLVSTQYAMDDDQEHARSLLRS